MDTQNFTHEDPTCPCGAQLDEANRTLCRKCRARQRWNLRRLPRGGHGGADRGTRTRRTRRTRDRDGRDA